MQFLFKRRKNTQESNETINQKSLSKIVEKGYFYTQSKWAEWMTKQTAKLSVTNQLVVFGFFIACASGYSIYLISISFSDTHSKRITVSPIVEPLTVIKTDEVTIKKNSSVSKIEFEKITRFRSYMDSLVRSPAGKKVYDSIINKRRGLLDSLAIIENYYQSNFKKYYHGK